MNVFYRLPEGFPLEEAVQRFPQIFRPRQADSHKGTFGTLAVLGGAAADVLRASGAGEIGLLAGEIAPSARWLRNQTIENKLQLSV